MLIRIDLLCSPMRLRLAEADGSRRVERHLLWTPTVGRLVMVSIFLGRVKTPTLGPEHTWFGFAVRRRSRRSSAQAGFRLVAGTLAGPCPPGRDTIPRPIQPQL